MIEDHAVPSSPGEASVTTSFSLDQPPASGRKSIHRGKATTTAAARAWIVGEPAIDDLMADPIIHAVLRRDSLELEDLRQAIALGRRRLSPGLQIRAA